MLNQINDYQEYSELLRLAKIEYAPMRSNLFLFPEEVKQYIDDGRLFYGKDEDSIVFIKEEKDINRLYFCISPKASKVSLKRLEKYTVVEIPRKTSQAIDISVDETLINGGFSFFRKTVRMKAVVDQTNDVNFHTVSLLNEDDAEAVRTFLYRHFDVRADFILDLVEIKALIRDKMVYGTRESDGEIASCVLTVKHKKQLELRAIAVAPKHRGCGLAQELCAAVFSIAKREECRAVFLWTASDNTVAQKLYKKIGFLEDGCYSDLYYMEKET